MPGFDPACCTGKRACCGRLRDFCLQFTSSCGGEDFLKNTFTGLMKLTVEDFVNARGI